MRPDESNNGQGGAVDPTTSSQNAAARVVRAKIDSIYNNSDSPPNEQAKSENPYQRTHQLHSDPQAEQWKQYHSAWQNYYQKYYEGYYSHHLDRAKRELKEQTPINGHGDSENTSSEDPIFKLRQKLLETVRQSAAKVKKSRHFVPIISGIAVVIIFLFLQYNRVILSNAMAYISPGNIDPQNIVINPDSELAVSPEPRLIIPKINVDAPVAYDISNDYNSQMAAMANGLAHFSVLGASSHPGEIGNTVISGHSSNDLFDTGNYKFIFVQLDKLTAGDMVYANYKSKRYTYVVTKKEVVGPTDVSKLVYTTTKPILTLVTCTPIGTAKYRLLVTAEQISPDPNEATVIPTPTSSSKSSATKSMPGNTRTLIEWLFSGRYY